MEDQDILKKRPGDGTARAASALIEHLGGKPYRVIYDHPPQSSEKSDTGHIVSWYFSEEGWKAPLSQIDIAVVEESEPGRVLALIEIEETNERPKNLLGDVFAILMGNGILCNGKEIKVGHSTRIIVLAKRSIVESRRINYLSQKVDDIKSKVGIDVQEMGKVVIRAFDTDLPPDAEMSLEAILKHEVDQAIESKKGS